MSKRLDVLRAITELIRFALPGVDVRGPDDDDSRGFRPNDIGHCVVSAGDPGEPEVDLGVLTYWYNHSVPVELTVTRAFGRSAEDQIDEMLAQIGAAIQADRYLGGLCIWVEPTAAATSDIEIVSSERDAQAGRPPRGADFSIIATYGSPNPLT